MPAVTMAQLPKGLLLVWRSLTLLCTFAVLPLSTFYAMCSCQPAFHWSAVLCVACSLNICLDLSVYPAPVHKGKRTAVKYYDLDASKAEIF